MPRDIDDESKFSVGQIDVSLLIRHDERFYVGFFKRRSVEIEGGCVGLEVRIFSGRKLKRELRRGALEIKH